MPLLCFCCSSCTLNERGIEVVYLKQVNLCSFQLPPPKQGLYCFRTSTTVTAWPCQQSERQSSQYCRIVLQMQTRSALARSTSLVVISKVHREFRRYVLAYWVSLDNTSHHSQKIRIKKHMKHSFNIYSCFDKHYEV